jgi:demethylmenaquinone methyltransferase/2-methoxy-6-polyprenyl-1,4-benzoquinol methylase
MVSHGRNFHARRIFDSIADSYEGPAQAFSFLQYSRWRHFLVSRLQLPSRASVLDVCTGTGLVALEIARTRGSRVVGVDLSDQMIQQARRKLAALGEAPHVGLVKGRAESLPFAEHAFDAVVFTFLLRYVDDPQATLCELARVLRPGGTMASLEFFVPQGSVPYALWLLHTRLVLPLGARVLSPGWREVGSFLGPSISAFYQEHTLEDLGQMWERSGLSKVQTKVLSFGGAVVTWGWKEADDEI